MNKIPEEIVKLAESCEVKVKTTKPQEAAFAVHNGFYQKRKACGGSHIWQVEKNRKLFKGMVNYVNMSENRKEMREKEDQRMFLGEEGSKGVLK